MKVKREGSVNLKDDKHARNPEYKFWAQVVSTTNKISATGITTQTSQEMEKV